MSGMDWAQLDADHPTWVYLQPDECRRRYWAYDRGIVAQARLVVLVRRLLARWLP